MTTQAFTEGHSNFGQRMSRGVWKQPPRPTPASCWLLAVVLVVLCFASLMGIAARGGVPPSEAFTAFNEARLADLSTAAARGSTRVIMLGNSRLKYATLPEEELEQRSEMNAEIVRIVNNWAVFEDFGSLLEQILRTEASLIVLQEDLFIDEWSYLNEIRHVHEYVRWRLFGIGPWNPGGVDHRALQFDTPCNGGVSERSVQERLERTGKWLVRNQGSASAAAAYRFVERALNAGIDVAVLSIPRSSPMEAAVPEGRLERATILRRHGVEFWRYSKALADGHFCDEIHLNPDGRRLFSEWLLDNLRTRV